MRWITPSLRNDRERIYFWFELYYLSPIIIERTNEKRAEAVSRLPVYYLCGAYMCNICAYVFFFLDRSCICTVDLPPRYLFIVGRVSSSSSSRIVLRETSKTKMRLDSESLALEETILSIILYVYLYSCVVRKDIVILLCFM